MPTLSVVVWNAVNLIKVFIYPCIWLKSSMNNDYQEMRDKQNRPHTHTMWHVTRSILKTYYNLYLMSIIYFIAYRIDIYVFERNRCELHNNGERMNYMNR